MTQLEEGRPRPQSVPESLVRTLRHEVGDLLQTVYAAVAILKERLPAECQAERRILTDMRARAESCRDLLDTVHDLVCPITLSIEAVDLGELVGKAVSRVAPRFPKIRASQELEAVPLIQADSRRLQQLTAALLADACAEARETVRVSVRPGAAPGNVEMAVMDDGPGVPPDKEELLFHPVTSTPRGHLGPGLALVQRLVALHGGSITAGNAAGGGFRVAVTLPAQPSASA